MGLYGLLDHFDRFGKIITMPFWICAVAGKIQRQCCALSAR
ncbi:Uncharacterised protein [Vibrio cholerae]|nr:Uncharacterised protein [Vibrio cholerae]